MIFLVLTLAFAQQPTPCEHYLEPVFCHGPGMKHGSVCSWDSSEARCVTGRKHTPPVCLSSLPADQCANLEKCYWDLAAGKCRKIPAGGASVPAGYPGRATPRPHKPATRAPTTPTIPVTRAPETPAPATYPPQYPANPATGAPQYPGYPAWPYPAYPPPQVPVYPAYPGAHPGQPPLNPGQPPMYPPQFPVPGYLTPTQGPGFPNQASGQNPAQKQTTPVVGQECKLLKKQTCFGPSKLAGNVCFWDAEDEECYPGLRGDVEALCAQFTNSRADCDAQLECFFDAKDSECTEVEMYGAEAVPAYDSVCESHFTVDDCASEPSCFFEDGVCVNLIQARNICGVLSAPQLCSTNSGCVWQDNVCQISAPKFRLRNVRPASGSDIVGRSVEGIIYLLAGIMVGTFITFSCMWICGSKGRDSNFQENYMEMDYSRKNTVV